MVEGNWRVKDIAEGWEMMVKGPIFCSASFQAAWLVWMWSVCT